jgi:Acyl-coenzyme A:6-aminopenicillanic acid acyl-transferase
MMLRNSIVCGSPQDFMEVRAVSLTGSDREAGRALATIARDQLGISKTAWTDPAATRSHRAWLREHWPAHYERMLGAADVYGVDPENDRLDCSFLFYYWAVPDCSNVFYPPARTATGHAILSRNYDFSTGTVFELMGLPEPADARNATCRPFVISMRTPLAYATLLTTSYELLGGCIDGVNEHGLGGALLASVEVLTGRDTYRPLGRNGVGLIEIQLLRFVLESCTTAEEASKALDRLPQYYATVPCHYLIADRHGDAFVWSHASRPESPIRIDGSPARPLAITNHLPETVIAPGLPREESVARLRRLGDAISAAGERPDLAEIRRTAASVAATLPPGEGQYRTRRPARTLWHAFYDLEERSAAIDFYLGDDANGAIRRTKPLRFVIDGERLSHTRGTATPERGERT